VVKVEKAKISDVPQIHKLVNHFAVKGQMLARPLSELYEDVRDYFVVRDGDVVLGCGSAHVCWSDLVEIKAVAVDERQQRAGIGSAIIKACIEDAKAMGMPEIFCLTYEPTFFGRFGFAQVGLLDLPRKVWGECQRCPKYPDCDETAMILKLR